MTEINSNSISQTPEVLHARLEVLKRKMAQLNLQLGGIIAERQMMENKISDAQTRIQKILNKLPQSTDTRQLNLLEGGSMETPIDE